MTVEAIEDRDCLIGTVVGEPTICRESGLKELVSNENTKMGQLRTMFNCTAEAKKKDPHHEYLYSRSLTIIQTEIEERNNSYSRPMPLRDQLD